MSVHDDSRNAEGGSEDHIAGFAPHPGKFDQFFQRLRHLAVMLRQDRFGAIFNVFGFIMKKAGGTNQIFNGFKGRSGKISRRFKMFKKHRGNLVYLFVGALGRKNGGNQKLKRILMKQLRFDFGINLSQNLTNFISACF
jgi:hypothetical protein